VPLITNAAEGTYWKAHTNAQIQNAQASPALRSGTYRVRDRRTIIEGNVGVVCSTMSLKVGDFVSTKYGRGRILNFRSDDEM
jgi:hypothetical protein